MEGRGSSASFHNMLVVVPGPQHHSAPHGIDTTRLGLESPSDVQPTMSASSTSSEELPTVRTSRPPRRRREKPRIELAPDQPPTTQGKQRDRVFVACVQCRTRKIRCDGAKPICYSCSRRPSGGTDCSYDTAPKRRGPDRMPGSRQRLVRDPSDELADGLAPVRRRRRRPEVPPPDVNKQDGLGRHLPDPLQQGGVMNRLTQSPLFCTMSSGVHSEDDTSTDAPLQPIDLSNPDQSSVIQMPHYPYMLGAMVPSTQVWLSPEEPGGLVATRPYSNNQSDDSDDYLDSPSLASQPSLQFSKKIWWDSLISLYSSPSSRHPVSLAAPQRELAASKITSDLHYLFRVSNYWFSFFHLPTFFRDFRDPTRRQQLQPSLILSALSLSTLWQSSQLGYGEAGQRRAMRFREEAQSALDASLNVGFIDEKLAQAAWLLAMFEICAHPQLTWERISASMVQLDAIIRYLQLTTADLDNASVSTFAASAVPHLQEPAAENRWLTGDIGNLTSSQFGCSCKAITLNQHSPRTVDYAPLWECTPAWSPFWSEAQIQQESCRRLCWSSLTLIAGQVSYSTATTFPDDLFITNPANYAILFSGESISASMGSRHSKSTIWALYDRAFLLWHSCMRMRHNPATTIAEKAHFTTFAWLEADALEAALNRHTCDIERAFIYYGREFIFNTRMIVSYEFQRFIPLVTSGVDSRFHRKKAEEWLSHQALVARQFMTGLHNITGNKNNLLDQRPFFVFWFMGQVSRALRLWDCDSTLLIALDVCKAFLPAIDYLTELWPCPRQRLRYNELRQQVVSACRAAAIPLPPSPAATISGCESSPAVTTAFP